MRFIDDHDTMVESKQVRETDSGPFKVIRFIIQYLVYFGSILLFLMSLVSFYFEKINDILKKM